MRLHAHRAGTGAAAYGVLSKTVTLTVDGHSDTFRTFGDDVSDVLAAKNVTLRPGDRLNRPAAAAIGDGDTIEVAYAKPVTLAVDGTVTEHTIYDRTVGDALDTLDVDVAADAYVSARPTSVIPRKGMNQVMDDLYALGARAILVTAIHAARL